MDVADKTMEVLLEHCDMANNGERMVMREVRCDGSQVPGFGTIY